MVAGPVKRNTFEWCTIASLASSDFFQENSRRKTMCECPKQHLPSCCWHETDLSQAKIKMNKKENLVAMLQKKMYEISMRSSASMTKLSGELAKLAMSSMLDIYNIEKTSLDRNRCG